MILKELSENLDKIFHKNLAYKWDNVGLQIGNTSRNIERIIVSLDINSDLLDEAIGLGADLIIAHHPLIFNPISSITNEDCLQNQILNFIENKIAIYVAHTNYDIMPGGLNDLVAEKLDLINIKIIEPQYEQWYKFVVFVPKEDEERIREVICKAGGGKWKNYSCCTFNIEGKGSFIPLNGAKPYIGEVGNISYVNEVRIECIVGESVLDKVVKSTVDAHPYEEVAYDIYKIENKLEVSGIGRYGEIKTPVYFIDFLEDIKNKLKIRNFKWLSKKSINFDLRKKLIKKIAVVCGSANSLTSILMTLDCDLVILGEISYHNALNIVDSGKIIVEIGHSCSEKFAIENMYKKFKKFFKEKKIEVEVLESKVGYSSWRYYVD